MDPTQYLQKIIGKVLRAVKLPEFTLLNPSPGEKWKRSFRFDDIAMF
jgi:hypothetical protein